MQGLSKKDMSTLNSLRVSNEIIESDMTSYDFCKFAAIYFTSNATPNFSKVPLKQSLTDLPHLSDQLVILISSTIGSIIHRSFLYSFLYSFKAARALSITIFRFMGDLPEPETSDLNRMNTLTRSLSKNYVQTDSYNKVMNQESQHFLRITLKRMNKLNNIISKGKTKM